VIQQLASVTRPRDRRSHRLHLFLLVRLLAAGAGREPRAGAAVSVESEVRMGVRDLLERGHRDRRGQQHHHRGLSRAVRVGSCSRRAAGGLRKRLWLFLWVQRGVVRGHVHGQLHALPRR
jgi:hypothetical protein